MGVRLWVKPALLDGTELVLGGEDFHYLARVHRLAAGDDVTLFDGAGRQATARVVAVDGRHDAITLRRGDIEASALVRATAFTLIVALLKADKMDLVVQKATELGAARIIPVTTARAIARLDANTLRTMSRRSRWQKIAREASRQSGRLDVPEVESVTALTTALAASPKDALKLMLWEGARQTTLRSVLPPADEPPQQIVIAIGPEGGFTVEEVEAARHAGFTPVGLGPRILRTETAALVVLSILGYALGDLG